ncbi:MAG TPA: ABC transporter permease, partial [Candidatus Gallacutalibacter pullistercoris]|nr:ABC transporter permease [Candidatus Gallacutalibacter pullistercoris]
MFEQMVFAWRSLSRKRGRSILTILGIVIGVASVTVIGNISQCGSTALNNEMDSLGLSGLTISASSSAVLEQETLEIVQDSNEVEQAMPVLMQTGEISARNEQSDALLWGIDENAGRIISLEVLYGRGLN